MEYESRPTDAILLAVIGSRFCGGTSHHYVDRATALGMADEELSSCIPANSLGVQRPLLNVLQSYDGENGILSHD